MLPVQMPAPTLPYMAETDYYNGAACVQMVLNSCPNLPGRHYHSQADLYGRVSAHNTEPLVWFSDPNGIKNTLMDPILSPCGGWADFSGTDKEVVLGNTIYWVSKAEYLALVSITSTEKWVAVCGFESDAQPTPENRIVNLFTLYLYDPTPLSANPYSMVAASVWKMDAAYWQVPYNNPASAWHNKYIAVVEPPPARIIVKIPERKLFGRILPGDSIKRSFYEWLEHLRVNQLARGPFEMLNKSYEPGDPFLVNAGSYKYYIVPFADDHLVAIFNAYDGSFEEFRSFSQKQNYVLSPKIIRDNLEESLKKYHVRDFHAKNYQLAYRSGLAEAGRFSPTWNVEATVTFGNDKECKLNVILNASGNVIQGLEPLHKLSMVELEQKNL
jgi:hypothetical protein